MERECRSIGGTIQTRHHGRGVRGPTVAAAARAQSRSGRCSKCGSGLRTPDGVVLECELHITGMHIRVANPPVEPRRGDRDYWKQALGCRFWGRHAPSVEGGVRHRRSGDGGWSGSGVGPPGLRRPRRERRVRRAPFSVHGIFDHSFRPTSRPHRSSCLVHSSFDEEWREPSRVRGRGRHKRLT